MGGKLKSIVRKCRICGCSESDACYHPDHGNCWWVQEDLCSHCYNWPGEAVRYSQADKETVTIDLPLGMNAENRSKLLAEELHKREAFHAIEGKLHKAGYEDMDYGYDEDLAFADSITITFLKKPTINFPENRNTKNMNIV